MKGWTKMRVDLPICNFEKCRHNLDSNCMKSKEYIYCEYNKLKGLIGLLGQAANEIENKCGVDTELTVKIKEIINSF